MRQLYLPPRANGHKKVDSFGLRNECRTYFCRQFHMQRNWTAYWVKQKEAINHGNCLAFPGHCLLISMARPKSEDAECQAMQIAIFRLN